jgi:Holliday junction resolvasome RuvABC endonuclease subunit
MARIKIEEIQEELAKDGWKLISDEYENLESEMIFECSEGHKVYATWKKIRQKRDCPLCKNNEYKEQDSKVIPKKKGEKRILALDQATHITGWSIYDSNKLIKYGLFETELPTEMERDFAVKTWLINMINNWQPDFIGLEDIQLQQLGKGGTNDSDNVVGVQTFKTLAHLQGILMNTIYEKKIPFKLCPPPTWRAHCGVKGKSKSDKKKSMQLLVKKWFDVSVSNDEADAIGIGKFTAETYNKQTEIVSWE